jgi:hypothetical protein
MRLVLAALVAVLVTACETPANKRISATFQAPAERTRIVIMRPNVSMALLTAGGLEEPRADWTAQAEANLLSSFEQVVRDAGHDVVAYDGAIAAADRQTQLILLHDAVGGAILQTSLYPDTLPTKEEGFEWTLGAGAAELRDAYDADLALFVLAQGSFASGGRIAAAVLSAAIFGVAPSTGGQVTIASLVDLNTGDIVWMDMGLLGDPRDPEGARAIVQGIADDIPL